MAPEKKNHFLDASGSEDDQRAGYDSDNEMTKGGGRSANKRRKIDRDDKHDDDKHDDDKHDDDKHDDDKHDDDDDDDDAGDVSQDADEAQDEHEQLPGESKQKYHAEPPPDQSQDQDRKPPLPHLDTTLLTTSQPLAKKNLITTEAAIKKSGVIYISRIPPGMKPSTLRALLTPYGKLNRIFLAPEDGSVRARRRKAGGNKRVLFTEGWVEFLKKKDAKAACELLNAQNVGGKKGSFFRDDVWNLVYLRGFKWANLTEQITAENAERTSRMRAEISKASRENKAFVRNVEKAKMLDGMQAKARRRGVDGHGKDDGNGDGDAKEDGGRTFRQVAGVKRGGGSREQPDHVTRVLSKIF